MQNAGRSQMAAALLTVEAKGSIHVRSAGSLPAALAGLMRDFAQDAITVYSAGTKPVKALNPQAVESLTELGIDAAGEYPKPVTDEVLDTVDAVIVLGTEVKLEPREGTRFEVWETDEPSERGVEGMERLRLVRDDIKNRVRKLYTELTGN